MFTNLSPTKDTIGKLYFYLRWFHILCGFARLFLTYLFGLTLTPDDWSIKWKLFSFSVIKKPSLDWDFWSSVESFKCWFAVSRLLWLFLDMSNGKNVTDSKWQELRAEFKKNLCCTKTRFFLVSSVWYQSFSLEFFLTSFVIQMPHRSSKKSCLLQSYDK